MLEYINNSSISGLHPLMDIQINKLLLRFLLLMKRNDKNINGN